MTSIQSVGLQVALDIIEARRHKPEAGFLKYAPSLGRLNTLIAELREHESNANAPVRVTTGYEGKDWLIGFGSCERDGKDMDITIQTDRVHASELRGDALDDAECYVTLRNNLPVILGALEELLVYRTTATPQPGNPQ